jgi:hypothetical protein
MSSIKTHRKRYLILVSVLILAVLSACKPTASTQEPAAVTQPPTAEATPEPTAVSQKLLLVDPSAAAGEDVTQYLSEFAASNGLAFETINADTLPTLGEETRVVIYLTEPANLQDIISAAPQTQFIAVGSSDPAGSSNLSVIKSQPQDLAFMGGYLTSLIAWDWRSAGLIPNDTSLGSNYLNAFENGGRYVCGQCTPYYAPYYYFPLVLEESSSAGAAGWLAQTNSLAEYYVKAVYVDPSVASQEVMDVLAAGEYTLVGNAGTAMPERFTALLGYYVLPGLKQLLPQALEGKGGQSAAAQVKIASYTDQNLVTPAKIELFNETAASLASGWVSPYSIQ